MIEVEAEAEAGDEGASRDDVEAGGEGTGGDEGKAGDAKVLVGDKKSDGDTAHTREEDEGAAACACREDEV